MSNTDTTDKSSWITRTLWSLTALLVFSNVYTLNVLYNTSINKTPSINLKTNQNIPQRRQLLDTSENNDHINLLNANNIIDPQDSSFNEYNGYDNKYTHNNNNLQLRKILQNLNDDVEEDDFDSGSKSDLNNIDVDPFAGLSKEERDKKLVSPETVEEFYSTINENDVICDWSMEYLFNQTINLLYSLKSHNYMEIMNCPTDAQAGWRPEGYVPWIFGNQCESWWHRDAVFIMSHLLNKNMKALEYGSGASTLWMSHFVGYVIGIENDQAWFDRMANITSKLQIDNIEIRKFRVHIPYVEIDLDNNPGGFDWSLKNGGGIDFVSIDGRVRIHCTRWAIKKVKQHGGIVLLDNSDRDGDDGINATKLIPKHWLRYDSYNLPQHLKQLPGSRWLENSRTTIWITRHPKCMDNNPLKQ